MFELPKHFTGLFDMGEISKVGETLEAPSFTDFQKVCYELKCLGLISVQHVKKDNYPENYFEAFAKDDEGGFSILQNIYTPYCAFKSSEGFLLKSDIVTALSKVSNTIVLPPDILSTRVTHMHLGKLPKCEANAVKYWMKSNFSIGDMMFSDFFD